MNLTHRRAVNNITKVFNTAPKEIVDQSKDWYLRANKEANEISDWSGLPLQAVCHVIAALSPNTRWEQNVRDARRLIFSALAGENEYDFAVSGYPLNKRKAWLIAHHAFRGEDFTGILKGNKVTAFARNIEFPDLAQDVTVDFHAFSIASGVRYTSKSVPVISNKTYNLVSKAYKAVAKKVGLKAHQVQAITWIVWRKGKE